MEQVEQLPVQHVSLSNNTHSSSLDLSSDSKLPNKAVNLGNQSILEKHPLLPGTFPKKLLSNMCGESKSNVNSNLCCSLACPDLSSITNINSDSISEEWTHLLDFLKGYLLKDSTDNGFFTFLAGEDNIKDVQSKLTVRLTARYLEAIYNQDPSSFLSAMDFSDIDEETTVDARSAEIRPLFIQRCAFLKLFLKKPDDCCNAHQQMMVKEYCVFFTRMLEESVSKQLDLQRSLVDSCLAYQVCKQHHDDAQLADDRKDIRDMMLKIIVLAVLQMDDFEGIANYLLNSIFATEEEVHSDDDAEIDQPRVDVIGSDLNVSDLS